MEKMIEQLIEKAGKDEDVPDVEETKTQKLKVPPMEPKPKKPERG